MEKFTGEARWQGVVVSEYQTTKGMRRFVVDVEPQGFQMIAVPSQLRPALAASPSPSEMEVVEALSMDMEILNMIEHAGRGFMTGSIGNTQEPKWAAEIIRTILSKANAHPQAQSALAAMRAERDAIEAKRREVLDRCWRINTRA